MSNAELRAERLAFAQEMVTKLQNALRDTQAGVVYVMTEGVSVTYNRKDALAELEFWRKQERRYSRSTGRTSTIDLSGTNA